MRKNIVTAAPVSDKIQDRAALDKECLRACALLKKDGFMRETFARFILSGELLSRENGPAEIAAEEFEKKVRALCYSDALLLTEKRLNGLDAPPDAMADCYGIALGYAPLLGKFPEIPVRERQHEAVRINNHIVDLNRLIKAGTGGIMTLFERGVCRDLIAVLKDLAEEDGYEPYGSTKK